MQIEKLKRQLYDQRSARAARLLDQMEMSFEELESTATEDKVAAEAAVARTTAVAAFTRKPAHTEALLRASAAGARS